MTGRLLLKLQATRKPWKTQKHETEIDIHEKLIGFLIYDAIYLEKNK